MISRNEAKYIQSLYHKKNRDAEEVFVAEGVKLVAELLNSHAGIKTIYALATWVKHNPEVQNVVTVSESELKRISGFETPNEVVAVIQKKIIANIPEVRGKITLMLDGIQDPGNLGTIIRTADWFGVENIIAANDTADVYNPKVIQASMGSFIRVNIFYTDLKQFLSANAIPVYGSVLNGEDISSVEPPAECLLVTGNESRGIRNEILPFIQKKITIPRVGKADSLNAAIATGIILWKFCKRN
jgi:TrmH family RNA methyltransferase